MKAVGLCIGALTAGITSGLMAEVRIDYIEVFNPTYVNIHFDAPLNRTYTLQYRTVLSATNTTGWTNLFSIPNLGFNHYVVSDFRTNVQRYYRLHVTP